MIVKKSLYSEPERPTQQASARPTSRQANSAKYFASGFNLIKKLNFVKTLLVLILVLQVVFLYIALNPINLLNQLYVVNIVNRVSAKASIPPTEIPTVATIGDNTSLASIDQIKKVNDIYATVFKDAQNGDFVLAYTKKLVIYRQSEDKVIYEGDRPDTIISASLQSAIQNIVKLVKQSGQITQDSTETPQVSVVTDAALIKQQNSKFYADVQNNDLVATFSSKNLVVIFRPSTNAIVKSGQVNIN